MPFAFVDPDFLRERPRASVFELSFFFLVICPRLRFPNVNIRLLFWRIHSTVIFLKSKYDELWKMEAGRDT